MQVLLILISTLPEAVYSHEMAAAASSVVGMKRFTDQVVIVTGGAKGIGFGIGSRFLLEGKSRDAFACLRLTSPCSTQGAAHLCIFDSDEDACKKAVEVLTARYSSHIHTNYHT